MIPGPQHLSRRINGERVVVLGWPRAILMQFAHPLIAAGVADHSTFQMSRLAPLRRLHGTVRAMLGMTFGNADTAREAAGRINHIHDRVNGTLRQAAGRYPAGTPYSAHDPDLLAWVQLTLLDTMPRAYELLVAPLTTAEKDAYCVEARIGARLLGVPDHLVPVTYDEVSRGIAARLEDGSLIVTDTARSLADDLLHPSMAAPWPLSRMHRLLTIGLLPGVLREAYGLTWSVHDQASLDTWAARIRRASAHSPARLRRWRAARA